MLKKMPKILRIQRFDVSLHPQKPRWRKSVDALVSNTSGATRAGSTPALGTFQESVLKTRHTFFVS